MNEKNKIEYCPKCGRLTFEDNDFCVYCGSRMNDGQWQGTRGLAMRLNIDPPIYKAVCESVICGHVYGITDMAKSKNEKRFCPHCGNKCRIELIPDEKN